MTQSRSFQFPAVSTSAVESLHTMFSQRAVRITYIAGQFPLPSETFVYREVRELRKRGWHVTAVSLQPQTEIFRSLHDLQQDRLEV